LGLSKVARLAKMFARRLQNQHRFTQQLLEAFNAEVQPLGCSAIVEARHLGREQCTTATVTASTLGCFYARPEVFLQVRTRV
jgi:GTP cyclohydrolase I